MAFCSYDQTARQVLFLLFCMYSSLEFSLDNVCVTLQIKLFFPYTSSNLGCYDIALSLRVLCNSSPRITCNGYKAIGPNSPYKFRWYSVSLVVFGFGSH